MNKFYVYCHKEKVPYIIKTENKQQIIDTWKGEKITHILSDIKINHKPKQIKKGDNDGIRY